MITLLVLKLFRKLEPEKNKEMARSMAELYHSAEGMAVSLVDKILETVDEFYYINPLIKQIRFSRYKNTLHLTIISVRTYGLEIEQIQKLGFELICVDNDGVLFRYRIKD